MSVFGNHFRYYAAFPLQTSSQRHKCSSGVSVNKAALRFGNLCVWNPSTLWKKPSNLRHSCAKNACLENVPKVGIDVYCTSWQKVNTYDPHLNPTVSQSFGWNSLDKLWKKCYQHWKEIDWSPWSKFPCYQSKQQPREDKVLYLTKWCAYTTYLTSQTTVLCLIICSQ